MTVSTCPRSSTEIKKGITPECLASLAIPERVIYRRTAGSNRRAKAAQPVAPRILPILPTRHKLGVTRGTRPAAHPAGRRDAVRAAATLSAARTDPTLAPRVRVPPGQGMGAP